MECSILLMGNTVEMAGGWHKLERDDFLGLTRLIQNKSKGLEYKIIQPSNRVKCQFDP